MNLAFKIFSNDAEIMWREIKETFYFSKLHLRHKTLKEYGSVRE